LDKLKFPNPQQQGFQKDLSCITAAFNLQETVLHYNDHGSPVYVAFLDCKKAYDTVWRNGLFVKLHNLGLHGKILSLLDDCHIDNESTVIVNNQTSKWFPIEQGVRQGGVLSGFLYCVFINELLNMLECTEHNFGVFNVKSTNPTLADGITCFSSSALSLQKLLDNAYTYSCLWRFSFNAQKSSVVVFGKTNHLVQHSWTLGSNSISVSDNYKHLGNIQQTKFSRPRGAVVRASGSRICGTWVPVFRMRPYKPRSRVAVGVAR
jgi:hypothetical protein